MNQPQQTRRINFKDEGVRFDESERLLDNGAPFTGEAVETLPDGTITLLNNYVDGIEDGIQREYMVDGTLSSEYNVVNGLVSGVALEWHPNGQVAVRKEYDEFGVPRKIEEWDEDGNLEPGAINSW